MKNSFIICAIATINLLVGSINFHGSDIFFQDLQQLTQTTSENEDTAKEVYTKVSSTAYYDVYNYGYVCGYKLTSNYTLAGMSEWRHKKVELYECEEDGSVGKLLGIYQFQDVGYGQSTGYGQSQLLDGMPIGTIENGSCIDIYMDTYYECVQYGRRDIYMKWID